MADELLGQAPETPDTDGQVPQGTTEAAQLDAEALAKEVKALRKEAAGWRNKLRQAEEEAEARKRAEMTELERVKADLEAERKARQEADDRRQALALRTQVVTAAARMNFADPEDALRMLDQSALEVDDAGNIDGLDAALNALAKAKPYLIKTTTGTISPTNPVGGKQPTSAEQMRAEMFGPKNTKLFDGGGVFWSQE